GANRTSSAWSSAASHGASRPPTAENPMAAGSARVSTATRIVSGSNSSSEPTQRSATATASMSATSWSSSGITTRTTFAGRATDASSVTAPVASNPAAEPATVGSDQYGNALLVPVDSGITGRSG